MKIPLIEDPQVAEAVGRIGDILEPLGLENGMRVLRAVAILLGHPDPLIKDLVRRLGEHNLAHDPLGVLALDLAEKELRDDMREVCDEMAERFRGAVREELAAFASLLITKPGQKTDA